MNEITGTNVYRVTDLIVPYVKDEINESLARFYSCNDKISDNAVVL